MGAGSKRAPPSAPLPRAAGTSATPDAHQRTFALLRSDHALLARQEAPAAPFSGSRSDQPRDSDVPGRLSLRGPWPCAGGKRAYSLTGAAHAMVPPARRALRPNAARLVLRATRRGCAAARKSAAPPANPCTPGVALPHRASSSGRTQWTWAANWGSSAGAPTRRGARCARGRGRASVAHVLPPARGGVGQVAAQCTSYAAVSSRP